ncbi:MAG: LON peptidase substrate-binding domain-containing protein [Burkholderiales bacterium]|nr:LON peptidase substrate-binding domain-containing protein [Burkholderiales bacterium]
MAHPLLTLTCLPLFPLGTVLFPGGQLPLRVFEVRYLDMIGRCHRAGAPFGVVALAQGQEVRTPGAPQERLQPVGTLARITALEQPQPGLLLIQCQGEQRFRIDQPHQLRHGLWVADVSLLPPDPVVTIPDDLQAAARTLRRAHDSLRRQPQALPLPATDALDYDDCGWVANRWCELLPLPTTTRQHLMSLDSPLLRLELVADMLSRGGIDGSRP